MSSKRPGVVERGGIIVEGAVLNVGRVFDILELIVEKDEESMATVGWQSGIENGMEYEMRCFMYDLVKLSRGRISVSNNGYREIFPDDEEYHGYADKLKSRGMFPEE